MGSSRVHLSSERRDGLSIYWILEPDQVVTISLVWDFRVLGRHRHQVVQDYYVSYSRIEEVVAVQVHRDASTKFYSWEHGLSDDVVEGLPSLVQPDDSLRQWRHLGPTVL